MVGKFFFKKKLRGDLAHDHIWNRPPHYNRRGRLRAGMDEDFSHVQNLVIVSTFWSSSNKSCQECALSDAHHLHGTGVNMGRDKATPGVVNPGDGHAECMEAGNLVDVNRVKCKAKWGYWCPRTKSPRPLLALGLASRFIYLNYKDFLDPRELGV